MIFTENYDICLHFQLLYLVVSCKKSLFVPIFAGGRYETVTLAFNILLHHQSFVIRRDLVGWRSGLSRFIRLNITLIGPRKKELDTGGGGATLAVT